MWSSGGYIVSIIMSFSKFECYITTSANYDSKSVSSVKLLNPWHEMRSGEGVVKSGKPMSIAVSMKISVELRAALARERILKLNVHTWYVETHRDAWNTLLRNTIFQFFPYRTGVDHCRGL